MKDRTLHCALAYAEDLYFKAKEECVDGFIYEARSLYTLIIAHTQSYNFTLDEIEDHIRALEHKIKLVWMYLATPCEKYLKLLDQIKEEINNAKQKEAKQ